MSVIGLPGYGVNNTAKNQGSGKLLFEYVCYLEEAAVDYTDYHPVLPLLDWVPDS